MEDAAKIRFSAKIQVANRERAEADTRSKVYSEIWEKAEKTRKLREAKSKAEAETVERARVWAKAKSKEKS